MSARPIQEASAFRRDVFRSTLARTGIQCLVNLRNGSKLYCEVVGKRDEDVYAVMPWGCTHEIKIEIGEIASMGTTSVTLKEHRRIRVRQRAELEGPSPSEEDQTDEGGPHPLSESTKDVPEPTSCEPGATVKAEHTTLGTIYGEVLESKISGERIAIALFGTGRSVLVDPSTIEKVDLSGKQICAVATQQQSLFRSPGGRMRLSKLVESKR